MNSDNGTGKEFARPRRESSSSTLLMEFNRITVPRMILTLEVQSAVLGELSLTLPYMIVIRLLRLDDTNKSCILRWNPEDAFVKADFLLVRVTEEGPERVHIDAAMSSRNNEASITFTGWNPYLEELPPGGELKRCNLLPMYYQQALKAGNTYQLLWPGGEVDMWDWGTKAEHAGKEMKVSQQRTLFIPRSEPITFTAKQEMEPWPKRPETTSEAEFHPANVDELRWRYERNPPPSPSPLGPSERVSGRPVLKMEIDCPRKWSKGSLVYLRTTVTYEGLVGGNTKRPITFHATPFRSPFSVHSRREGVHLYQHLKEKDWKEVVTEAAGGGFAIFDKSPIPVLVGDDGEYNDQFVTLRVGESWTHERLVQWPDETSLPSDVEAGAKFKYINKGAIVDWWDWGTKDDHKNTAVKLPCFITGDLEEPTDNGGRPRLIGPASNEVLFEYIG